MIDFKEKLSEVLENSRERFTNPLFYSFVISWCAFNWKVPVGLIWYTSTEIKDLGYETVFDFVGQNITAPFWAPFGIAILYTLLSPLFRNLLSVLTAFFNGVGNRISFKAAGKAPISVELYFESQENLKKAQKDFADVVTTGKDKDKVISESQHSVAYAQKQVADLQSERNNHLTLITAAQDALKKEQDEFDEFKIKMSNPTPLVAYYILTAKNDTGDIVQNIRIHFGGFTVGILDRKYEIRNYFFHPEKYQVLMSLYNKETKKSIYFDIAKHKSNNDNLVLVGFLNDRPITLTLDDSNEPQKPLLIDNTIFPTPVVLRYKDGTTRTFVIKIVDGNIIFTEPASESLIEMNAMLMGNENIEPKLRLAIQYVLSKIQIRPSDYENFEANIFNSIMNKTAREFIVTQLSDERSKLTVSNR